jgi:DNA-binding CsgD family transcriptional regulator
VNYRRVRLQGQPLSRPEIEVLLAAAEGLSAEETATRLIKSKHTVIAQRRSLQAKLGARNLPHAVALAFQQRLLEDEQALRTPGADAAWGGDRLRGLTTARPYC